MIIQTDVLDYDFNSGKEIIAKGNRIIDLVTNETLLQFDHPVVEGIKIINNHTFYGSDLWGGRKIRKSLNVDEVPYIVKSALKDDLCIVLFKKRKATAKIDLEGNILWEHQYYPLLGGILKDIDIVVLLDGADQPTKRLLFVRITTGEILSSLICGESAPRILGFAQEIIWIASKDHKLIVSIDYRTGQIVDEVSVVLIAEILQNSVDIENFKFDANSLKLVHPIGDLELRSMEFIKRNLPDFFDNDGDIWIPSVFPFVLDENYLVFGMQIDNPKNEKTETRLIVMDRFNNVILNKPISSEALDAGLKKMVILNEKLIYLDSFNNLHKVILIHQT